MAKQRVPVEQIARSILILRGQRVILDSDLALIYGVSTGRFNEAVKRNIARFPQDFMLRLSDAEHAALISQNATSKPGRGGRRKLPWAFTEHGAIQAANVLNSPRAIAMGVYVVRAFVQLRDLLTSNNALAQNSASWSTSSRTTIRRSPPSSRRSVNSCIRRCPSAGLSDSPPTWRRSHKQALAMNGSAAGGSAMASDRHQRIV